jgi:hypothetical protein
MRSALVTAFVVSLALASALCGQEGPQRGKLKKFDAEKGVVTITAADGRDVECAIVPQTMFRDANNNDIVNFREKGLPTGTNVMFRAEERGGRMVLVGLRLPPAGGAPAKGGGQRPNVPPPPPPRDSIGVKPLTELGTEKYKGESGGLYGHGSNEPPAAQQAAAKQAAAKIQPLDARGQPSTRGKIGLLGVGMSNTTLEFSTFKRLADSDPRKSANVAIIDVAQGGQAASQWTDLTSETGKRVWGTVDQRLKAADVTNEQVQVVWIKQALIGQAQYGEFPAHAEKLESDLVTTLQLLKQRFPNLQIAYLSSRIYAGYATTPLNPEPYAYEGAFAMRWIIESQVKGDPQLNADPARGDVKSPVVLWGPYLWGDGTTPRKDGLVWNRDDLTERDGTHPSPSGQKKVADLLTAFFHSDPYAKNWYLK